MLLFGGCQDLGVFREVGDEPEDEEGDADCEDTFEDEDPSNIRLLA
jgi:hypothetical protein